MFASLDSIIIALRVGDHEFGFEFTDLVILLGRSRKTVVSSFIGFNVMLVILGMI